MSLVPSAIPHTLPRLTSADRMRERHGGGPRPPARPCRLLPSVLDISTTGNRGPQTDLSTTRSSPDASALHVVRGLLSTGFRAPSLGQSFFSSTATNFLNLGQGLVPVESLTLHVDSAPAKVLGAVPLKPENSRHASAGVVVTPLPRLEVAVEHYRIAIGDRIARSGNFTAAPIAALLAPFGANSARFQRHSDVSASVSVRHERPISLWENRANVLRGWSARHMPRLTIVPASR
jgi:iron complex outermembrane receptor protein